MLINKRKKNGRKEGGREGRKEGGREEGKIDQYFSD
jgi:hypothetical protein